MFLHTYIHTRDEHEYQTLSDALRQAGLRIYPLHNLERPATLTKREFELFYLLYLHSGQVFTLPQIAETIWGFTGHGARFAKLPDRL